MFVLFVDFGQISLLDKNDSSSCALPPRSSPFFRTGREGRNTQFQVAFYVISLSYWGISLELGLVILEHQNRVRDLLLLEPSWPPLSFWFDFFFGMIYNPFLICMTLRRRDRKCQHPNFFQEKVPSYATIESMMERCAGMT